MVTGTVDLVLVWLGAIELATAGELATVGEAIGLDSTAVNLAAYFAAAASRAALS